MELKQKLVYGWGINDSNEKYAGCKAQSTWRGILQRCFSEKFKLKYPTYSECSVCEEWKYFSDFKKWYDLNSIPNYDLDKDILFVGNKHYSPDTCCFVPSYVNCVLLKQNRNHLPVGVSQAKLRKTYQAKVSINNVNTLIGCFKSAAEAHIAWQTSKADVIFRVIERYSKEIGFNTRVACALNARAWNLLLDAASGTETISY